MPRKSNKSTTTTTKPTLRDWGVSSGFIPRLNLNCKDGVASVRVGDEAIELSLPISFELDIIAGTMLRVRKFEGRMLDMGPYEGQKVDADDGWKVHAIIPLYGADLVAELGGQPLGLRTIESSAKTLLRVFESLELLAANAGKPASMLPIVELREFQRVSVGKGSAAVPQLFITGWAKRRKELVDYLKDHGLAVDRDLNDDLPDHLLAAG